jgi:hypothetical protein
MERLPDDATIFVTERDGTRRVTTAADERAAFDAELARLTLTAPDYLPSMRAAVFIDDGPTTRWFEIVARIPAAPNWSMQRHEDDNGSVTVYGTKVARHIAYLTVSTLLGLHHGPAHYELSHSTQLPINGAITDCWRRRYATVDDLTNALHVAADDITTAA